MTRSYSFPVPREERILMLVGAILGPATLGMLVVSINSLADTAGYSFWEFFSLSLQLRGAFFAMVLVILFGLYGLVAFSRVKNGSELVLDDGMIRYRRPGAPGTGWFAVDKQIDPERVDRIEVSRQRRITLERIELAIESGHESIVVNLSHAEGPGQTPSSRLIERKEWLDQPIVSALETMTGKEAVRG